jgi:hypothetical protein
MMASGSSHGGAARERRNAPFIGCVYLVGVPSLLSAMERAKPQVDNPDWRLGASLVVCALQKRRG